MRLGIDLGTTRTVVAVSDRGNYPVVGFETPDGDTVDYFPSVVADDQGKLLHGHEAVAAVQGGAQCLRSFKRLLSQHGPEHRVRVGTVDIALLELTTAFVAALRAALQGACNVPRPTRGPLDAFVAVPANAHSNQRFTTLEAFRRAGFRVRAMLNEPSAAGIEYAQRFERSITRQRERVAIYDLGGGTFDAAQVMLAAEGHEVLRTAGVQQLGGDELDAALLELACERAGAQPMAEGVARQASLAECRTAKEAINPQTRRVHVELYTAGAGGPTTTVTIDVADYYARIQPLIDRTVDTLLQVLPRGAGVEGSDGADASAQRSGLAGIYLVGGASALPTIGRRLRAQFGRRVHRSAYPSAAIAIGLAIAADGSRTQPVAERFTRCLGVFREADGGRRVAFDNLIAAGTPLPPPTALPLSVVRRYRAAHDIGHFRYVECTGLSRSGAPCGDVHPYGELRVPFTASAVTKPADAPVERLSSHGPLIEERYRVDAGGAVVVEIENLDSGRCTRHALR